VHAPDPSADGSIRVRAALSCIIFSHAMQVMTIFVHKKHHATGTVVIYH
jgi:hypothetical protein